MGCVVWVATKKATEVAVKRWTFLESFSGEMVFAPQISDV